jgi:hypothetical protein
MTNNLFTIHRKIALFTAMSVCLLSACGGSDRTEPYSPSLSSSSSSAAKVSTEAITQSTTTSTIIDHKEKSLQVMRDADEFYSITDAYVNFNLGQPNFTEGQVVLIDMGDVNGCAQHLNFSSLRAEQAGANSVKVVVSYSETAANTSGCSTVITRPYYLYYVQSRGPVVFQELIL